MGNYNKHVIIVGTARSGTSWLAETFAQQYRYRMLFEPEHETQTKKGHLLCDKYIEKPTDAPEAHHYLKQVFNNHVDCDWIGQCSNRRYKRHLWPFLPKKYIIKFVRANLSAVYMNSSFKIPVVHMIRNPYDVLHSQQQVRFPWLYNLEHFKNSHVLVNLIRASFDFDLTKTDHLSPLELLALRWSIENIVPLKIQQPKSDSYHILKYESLRENVKLFYDLCDILNIEPIKDLELHYKKPSSKTHPKSEIITNKSVSLKFTVHEYQKINKILDCFDVDLYPRTI